MPLPYVKLQHNDKLEVSIWSHLLSCKGFCIFVVLTIKWVIPDYEQSSLRQSCSVFFGHLQINLNTPVNKIRVTLILTFEIRTHEVKDVPSTCSHHDPKRSWHCPVHILLSRSHSWCCRKDCCNPDFPWNTARAKKWLTIYLWSYLRCLLQSN